MKFKKGLVIICLIAVVLAIPLIAMQFTDEVIWDVADFIVAGFLLLCLAIVLDYARMKIQKKDHRIAAILIILLFFILVFIELAVGIFGTPFAGS